jgi:hypothetical protein
MAELVLKLKGDFTFGDFEKRKDFAKFVAGLLSGDRSFEPEEVNAHNKSGGMEWSVNRGNDWWVFFDPQDKKRVRIKQRYDVREALIPLGGWIAYRYYCEVVTPEYQIPQLETAE